MAATATQKAQAQAPVPDTKHETDNVEFLDEKRRVEHNEEAVVGDAGAPARTSVLVNLSKWEAMKTCKRVMMFCFLALFGIMMDGYQVTVPGNLVANPGFIEQMGTFISERTGVTAIDPVHITLWSISSQIGAICIQPLVGFTNDRFGRRAVLWLMTTFLVAGLFVEMFARVWYTWLIGRILMGCAQGCAQAGLLTYLSEMAPTQVRGSVTSGYAIGWSMGNLVSGVGLYIISLTDPTNYLKAVYSEWATLGIWIIVLPFFPESPAWLIRTGRLDKAKKTLGWLYKGVEGYDVDHEIGVIQDAFAAEAAMTGGSGEVGWLEPLRGINLASLVVIVTQGFSGMMIVLGLTTYFFQQVGLDEPFRGNVIVYCVQITGISISLYLIERAGRRRLIITGPLLLCIINVVIASLYFAEPNQAWQNSMLALICLWVAVYAVTLSASCWGAGGEVSTPRLRAKTMSITIAVHNANLGIWSATLPLMLSTDGRNAAGWGPRTLYLFAITCPIISAGNYFLLPEAAGRTFAEMDEMYEKRIPPRKMGQYITEIERSGAKTHRRM